jgi:hypothetical protein
VVNRTLMEFGDDVKDVDFLLDINHSWYNSTRNR